MGKKEELRKEIIEKNDYILELQASLTQLREQNSELGTGYLKLQQKLEKAPPLGSDELRSVKEANEKYAAYTKQLEKERNSWRALATSYTDEIFSLQFENRTQIAKRVIATKRLEEHREKLRNEVAEKDYYITQLEAALEASKVI
jgi:chromosome segregation ATPase